MFRKVIEIGFRATEQLAVAIQLPEELFDLYNHSSRKDIVAAVSITAAT
jgi:hypothetical protein